MAQALGKKVKWQAGQAAGKRTGKASQAMPREDLIDTIGSLNTPTYCSCKYLFPLPTVCVLHSRMLHVEILPALEGPIRCYFFFYKKACYFLPNWI